MKIALLKLITILSFIFIILPYNSSTGSDKKLRDKNVKEELYKVKLRRENNSELIIFDTTVTLSYYAVPDVREAASGTVDNEVLRTELTKIL